MEADLTIAVRLTARPLADYLNVDTPVEARVSRHPLWDEAFYLAAPTFQHRIETSRGDVGTAASLERYLSRACSRTTPFGLFAGVGAARVTNAGTWTVDTAWRRQVTLDSAWAAEIYEALVGSDVFSEFLEYSLNPTLYEIGADLRLVTTGDFSRGDRRAELRQLRYSGAVRLVRAVLAGSLLSGPELKHRLMLATSGALGAAALRELVSGAIASQVVVGRLAWDAIRASPEAAGDGVPAAISAAAHALAAAESAPIEKSQRSTYERVAAAISAPIVDSGRQPPPLPAVQVDMINLAETEVPARWIAAAQAALRSLAENPVAGGASTRGTIERFAARFEAGPVDLISLFDDDLGIGSREVDDPGWQEPSPVMQGLVFGGRHRHDEASSRDVQLAAWLAMRRDGDAPLEISATELPDTPARQRAVPTLTAGVFRAIVDSSGNELGPPVLIGRFGPEGIEALSRFSLVDSPIRAVAAAWALRRRRLIDVSLGTCVHAELLYQPVEARHRNITRRPSFFEFCVAIGAPPSRDPSVPQIPLSDLLVTLQNDEFQLWSKSLDCRVVLHHSAALNVNLPQHPPIARFLISVARQGHRDPVWSWGSLVPMLFSHLPRVVLDGVVVSAAEWVLNREDAAGLASRQAGVRAAAVEALRVRGVPRFVIPAEPARGATSGDAPVVDLESDESVRALLSRVSPRQSLREFFVTEVPATFAARVIDVLVPSPQDVQPSAVMLPPRGESFDTVLEEGRAWAYCRVYVSPELQDRLLLAADRALADTDWFFVRYADAIGPHLRVRVRAAQVSAPELMSLLRRLVEDLGAPSTLIEASDYRPEILRFGGRRGLAVSHEWFARSSLAVCHLISTTENVADPMVPRLSLAVQTVVELADALASATSRDPLELLRTIRAGYRHHDEAGAALEAQLALKFRSLRKELSSAPPVSGIDLVAELCATGCSDSAAAQIVRSWMHMSCNRTFPRDQQRWERLAIDFAWRMLKARVGREHDERRR